MKNLFKLIIIALILLIAASAFIASERTFVLKSGVSKTQNSGKKLYLNNCARCHGADGKSQTEIGKRLDATDLTQISLSNKQVYHTIADGEDSMPAFKKKLSKKQINSIVLYVRALKR